MTTLLQTTLLFTFKQKANDGVDCNIFS